MDKGGELRIGKRTVKLTHVDRVLFPATGFHLKRTWSTITFAWRASSCPI